MIHAKLAECIKRSDGGVSERREQRIEHWLGVYQTFRWWGVGTYTANGSGAMASVSNVPMVGCRNTTILIWRGNSIPPNQNRRALRALGMKSPNLNYFVQLSILLNANFSDQVGTAANHAFT